jgi:misacylated tRNA(Ala) deacylase
MAWDEFFYVWIMAPTDLLYLTDSYLREFDAKVVEAQEHAVVLDQTAFYPRGGGQMSDRGGLEARGRRYAVINVEKRGDVVVHTLEGEVLGAGEQLRGVLDWDFRYQMMRTHSALHVLCGVIFHEYGSQVTGCQMYPDRARMDFTLADLTAKRVQEIERLTNQAIAAGYPVRVWLLGRQEAEQNPDLVRTKGNLIPAHIDPIRVVDIVGLDLQADGGTHVANTMEIGSIRITKTENKGRENRRLEIQLSPLTPS